MGNPLYNLFIQPLELLIELIFSVMKSVSGNYGLAIIMVSVVVNILIFPLYKRSDAMQEAEHKKQKEMEPWIKHIRKTFKGDERFMMLQTYYRQQNYAPVSAVKGSFSLLLQIPFFMAAYHFLSSIDMQGISFLFIPNLGAADHLIKIGPFAINLLPLLMTGFNLLSAAIYLKGTRLRDKIQTVVLALVFLVILYRSPSALVLYWTMNNFFSLLKNVFMKILGPVFSKHRDKKPENVKKEAFKKRKALPFILAALLITIVTGFVVPSAAVTASPEDFVSINPTVNPVMLIFNSLFICAGIFMVWGGIVYFVSKENQRNNLTAVFFALSIPSVINYMFFGRNLGTISPLFRFNDGLTYSKNELLISSAVFAVTVVLCLIIYAKKKALVVPVLAALCFSALILGSYQTISAQNKLSSLGIRFEGSTIANEDIEPIIPLSKEGKNVVVIMLDRAINDYFPYIVSEKPELKEAFDGFTYYPNTLSHGLFTVYGTPPLFGGYEYTPKQMNARSNEPLVDKHNEALKVMPVLFLNNEYEVTVCDPPYTNYQEITDLSVYDDYPEINTYVTMGKYVNESQHYTKSVSDTSKRNCIYYGILKAVPPVLQRFVYDYGEYYQVEKKHVQEPEFMNSYTVLDNLDVLTDIRDDDVNTFFMIDNNTTHAPCILSVPDYTPIDSSSESSDIPAYLELNGRICKLDNSILVQHYHVNMAAYLKLAEWFDFLRDNGLYDNTRIIIVADHGRALNQFDDLMLDEFVDIEGYHPILLYKDFNSTGFNTSDEFMTNADVPSLAVKDIIEKPINPFTGNVINNKDKENGQYITTSPYFELKDNPGNVFNTEDSYWYLVKDNIFDFNNWVRQE
ncbi:MAG: membrane protein insertase YidC [Lachnospiraceae bacterium]|nr:membrane protein insertase YidC [Lachnospiraceae bacterium]